MQFTDRSVATRDADSWLTEKVAGASVRIARISWEIALMIAGSAFHHYFVGWRVVVPGKSCFDRIADALGAAGSALVARTVALAAARSEHDS